MTGRMKDVEPLLWCFRFWVYIVSLVGLVGLRNCDSKDIVLLCPNCRSFVYERKRCYFVYSSNTVLSSTPLSWYLEC